MEISVTLSVCPRVEKLGQLPGIRRKTLAHNDFPSPVSLQYIRDGRRIHSLCYCLIYPVNALLPTYLFLLFHTRTQRLIADMRSLLMTLAIVIFTNVCHSLTAQSEKSKCESLAKHLDLSAYNATVLNSTYYPAGSYNASGVFNKINFCQVFSKVVYSTNPEQRTIFASWNPEANKDYKGRFLAVGNGGLAGTIDTLNMMTNLNLGLGFAIAGGDGGHDSNTTGSYIPFLHYKASVKAWIHNGISTFTPAAKAIVETVYSSISYSYYDGCSTGGAQGFALAQFHPTLFDGIVAGSPGNYYSHLALGFLYNARQTNSNKTYIRQEQLTAMTEAVVKACDGIDGVLDGVLENPEACQFEIDRFQCRSDKAVLNETVCLTGPQLKAAKAIYAGSLRSDNGHLLYPGFSLGSENAWAAQEGVTADSFTIPLLKNLVYNDQEYDPDTFDFASNVDFYTSKLSPLIDEINPDLHQYQKRGGKMIITQGWADPFNSPYWPIKHLSRIKSNFGGGDIGEWYRMFMVPAGGHCGANEMYPNTPATYLTVPELVSWVEGKKKPTQIKSTDPPSGLNRTRKLCPYPQTAHHVRGRGNVNDWSSYTCK